jgi:hypothetical protein
VVRVLQKIEASKQPVRNFSAYIHLMANYNASQSVAYGYGPSQQSADKSLYVFLSLYFLDHGTPSKIQILFLYTSIGTILVRYEVLKC